MNVLLLVYVVSLVSLVAGWLFILILVLRYSNAKTYEGAKDARESPTLSIVIPTYNEELVIESKLKNVSMVDYPREKLEVMVVDSASTDRTRQLVEAFMKKNGDGLNLRLIVQDERLGKASAMNLAFENCKGEIVIVTDADVLWSPEAPRLLVSSFSDPRVGGVSSMEKVANTDKNFLTRLEKSYKSFYNNMRLAQSNIDSTPMCESELSAYKRCLLDKMPMNRMCDDMELALTVRAKGYRTIYNPEVEFLEYEASAFRPKLRQKTRRAVANIEALIANRDKLFSRSCGKLGTITLPIEYFFNILSPSLFLICTMTSLFLMLTGNAAVLLRTSPLASLPLAVLAAYSVKKRLAKNLPLLILALIAAQTIVVVALLKLMLTGSTPAWETIQDVRLLQQSENRDQGTGC